MCKKFSALTSPYEKDSDDLSIPINVVFSPMLNDPLKTFNPIEEDGLQVFQCQALLYGFYSGDNLFHCLKRPVFHLVLQHSKELKVAGTLV
jgi:hypothetical protein